MKFLIFGTLPPPIGGVTKSVENLCNALKSKNVHINMYSSKSLLKRFDIAHIHYIKRWKILIAILIAKVISKKVILTYHGLDFYPDISFFDKTILKLLNGIIVLNSKVESRCLNTVNNQNKVTLLTPIFQEGFVKNTIFSNEIFFEREHDKKYLLLYAYDKVYLEGLEVYGGLFILNLLHKLPSEYILVFVDPQSGYKEDIEKNRFKDKIIYISKVINFESLLQSIDLYIRPTNYDGNSVAILEAIANNKKVLASDAVDRQRGIITYKNNSLDDFLNKLDFCLNEKVSEIATISSINEYLFFCKNI